ncbi:nitrite reductase large subunit NirB [Steroidobacter agaridevorans]|uniref:nitrite reductase large subunit NirB n=1 Tax=Steroidobacter agaridevorans TaxID=2695856 RepID=UPI0013279CE9|nr:nitrite reductase large subunit NirB [Steroidobacter agaridevorans]GFE87945.1 nitrite reductase large subunit [Steroidobacter agaridevorans]
MSVKKLVVIGNGMVGQRLLERLAAETPSHEITVLCEEPRAAYDRVQLTSFFSGKTAADLSLVGEDFFERNDIALHLNDKALGIDREARCVRTSQGRTLPYDQLVLATGSYPFVPPIPGRERPNCFVYRTIEDLEAIRSAATQSKVGVVIGGGLLGLEAAKALRDLGLKTHVVEFAPRLMAVQVDDVGGRVLRQKITEMDVGIHTGKSTTEIVDGEQCKHRLNFADGSSLEADVVVFSAGIRPRDELARACGLNIGARGGIVIDHDCRTSDPDIFAIGECALWNGQLFGLVAPGYQMANVCASRLQETAEPAFTGADMSTKLKLMGVDVASLGDPHCSSPGARAYAFVDERKQVYKKLVVNEDGTRLLGGILIGDADDYGVLLNMMLEGTALPASPEELIVPNFGGSEQPKKAGVAGLPATAQICSCNNVSKGAICSAIEAGATTIGALKSCTKAATSCGGCAALVTQVLKAELASRGVAVNNNLCEHFRYSRQQLFHLVRVGQLTSFDEVLKKHGRGMGCDICKPTVASILASCWNEFVLKRDKATLQDTNDYYLANMQKDGTYSVVPRIAGGEITPEKLIVIGEVAKKYGLYTKITGGQRIDLFGAQVHELPLIWRELIDAGFESGHAYGKSVRTVKSCVGSTWCRYGVQDSVGYAIDIENRYKGLRSPHKLKFAVSGCTRECAEAQSKDVGIIATEKGWNLYVCGNGGMKPRHADLLAGDLDRETLIRYIDRFLMFYIRTADRLQRTSVWLDNLEGGLDYLKQVVIEDKLGIAAELEADMARIVNTYECEWKKAVEDPQTLKRFRHFVNSDRSDDNVVFVQERGQIRPATNEERAQRQREAV